MANWDHRNNIGTHPILSNDEGTRLLARYEAARRKRDQASEEFYEAYQALKDYDARLNQEDRA